MNLRSNSASNSKQQKPIARWSQDRRLEFIDFTLRWEGQLNRSDLTNRFGISVPQSSLDIAKYTEIAPKNLRYDRSSRVYLATDKFESVYKSSSAEGYLHGLLSRQNSDIGGLLPLSTLPSAQTAPTPVRLVDEHILSCISRAIRQKSSLNISYQSMTSDEANSRLISPHAFGFDGHRWHIRAYCHTRKDFRDFVIARILQASHSDVPAIPGNEDQDWNTSITLVLSPADGLTDGQRKAIELDYGMIDGTTEISCSKAMLFYVLRRLRLLPERNTPQATQVVLKNHDEVNALIIKSASH